MQRIAETVKSLSQICALIILVVLLTDVTAPKGRSQDGSSKDEKEDLVRQHALSALDAILIESKTYDDQTLRIRVGAQVGDVLWPSNPGRA